VTPEQQSLILALAVAPGGREPLSRERFLGELGVSDGVALGLDLLRDAVARHDADDVELALIVCFNFSFAEDHLDLLVGLAFADWHQRHEHVATALGEIASSSAVDALHHLATWVPDYLDFDDARALATKAIWALGSIRADNARRALQNLAMSDSDIVARGAIAQLQR